jgi:hypothetical protein
MIAERTGLNVQTVARRVDDLHVDGYVRCVPTKHEEAQWGYVLEEKGADTLSRYRHDYVWCHTCRRLQENGDACHTEPVDSLLDRRTSDSDAEIGREHIQRSKPQKTAWLTQDDGAEDVGAAGDA